MSRIEQPEAEFNNNERMIETYRHRSDIEKMIAAFSRAENPELEMTLLNLVLLYDPMKASGLFSEEEWQKAFPRHLLGSCSSSPRSSVVAVNDVGSLQGESDWDEPLLHAKSRIENFIRYVSRGQQYRALLTRLYHAVTDFILAFPRENFKIDNDINLALLIIACALPGIRLTLTSIQIAKYALNYDPRMSDFEKSLPSSLKFKDQLARHWPVLSQDFVWFMLRGAACLRQDLALLFTLGLFSFLLSRNIVIDRANHHIFQRISSDITNDDEKKALAKLKNEVAKQDNVALGVAAFYTLGASLATIEYFQKVAALLVAGGSIIGLTALFNFAYEMWFKQSTTKLEPFLRDEVSSVRNTRQAGSISPPLSPMSNNRCILLASPSPALRNNHIDTAITPENNSPRSSEHSISA